MGQNVIKGKNRDAEFQDCHSNTAQVDISYARLEKEGLKLVKNGNTHIDEAVLGYNGHQVWKDGNFPWNRR